jgi:hypothetical protein
MILGIKDFSRIKFPKWEFLDKCPMKHIEFKKDLYKCWDGKNYDKFALDWARQRNLALEPSFDLDKNH